MIYHDYFREKSATMQKLAWTTIKHAIFNIFGTNSLVRFPSFLTRKGKIHHRKEWEKFPERLIILVIFSFSSNDVHCNELQKRIAICFSKIIIISLIV